LHAGCRIWARWNYGYIWVRLHAGSSISQRSRQRYKWDLQHSQPAGKGAEVRGVTYQSQQTLALAKQKERVHGQKTHERQEGMNERSIESYGKLDVIDSNDSPDGW